jgi:hypothetical protein
MQVEVTGVRARLPVASRELLQVMLKLGRVQLVELPAISLNPDFCLPHLVRTCSLQGYHELASNQAEITKFLRLINPVTDFYTEGVDRVEFQSQMS